ncbi:cytochrome c-type biogenesis protein [Mesobacterium pallidum]|uniref:cytochrome c-type biogenesis protein n=1 Tax=Mesobacterium pallidum TaxID=2872037 RepID=UPI001EE34773|nr:cytochrome c-type biogenesis protein [Mesobacterium pallidum]
MLAFSAPVLAVTPSEVLDDPVLESRAREISKGLRCPVCQNESIDESNASVSHDLRVLVRERLVAGDSNEEVVDYIVARYGEFVLLRPETGGANILLWAAGPLMLLIAGGVGITYLRRRSRAPGTAEATLSEAEEDRVRALLDE